MTTFQKAPRGLRLHIGLFGRRNVGKSSILNRLTRQQVSIVSEEAGTTTDPVEKPMELQPVGPVLFIDTAGVDDVGALGESRIRWTRRIFERADLALLVVEARAQWGNFEEKLFQEFKAREIPVITIFNKNDLGSPDPALRERLKKNGAQTVAIDCLSGDGFKQLREAVVKSVPEEFIKPPPILGDLLPPGELAVLVVPIDKEAPKGRLIMPQVQSIRDLLDHDAFCMVTKENELKASLSRLCRPPALVVTDSQAFLKVTADTPPEVAMTSFSIVFARYKGDLEELVRGAAAIDGLQEGDRILVAESCTHHPIGEDIGRVKIPRWLRRYTGLNLEFIQYQGHDFPEDLASYSLVIHCAGCVTNRREILSRIFVCRQAGVPITNYGVTIAYTLGIIERALSPFPNALEILRQAKRNQQKQEITPERT